jgi:hypothetical protein
VFSKRAENAEIALKAHERIVEGLDYLEKIDGSERKFIRVADKMFDDHRLFMYYYRLGKQDYNYKKVKKLEEYSISFYSKAKSLYQKSINYYES